MCSRYRAGDDSGWFLEVFFFFGEGALTVTGPIYVAWENVNYYYHWPGTKRRVRARVGEMAETSVTPSRATISVKYLPWYLYPPSTSVLSFFLLWCK